MPTMRAVQLVEAQVLEVREVPVPSVGPDEVLLAVAGAGLCHSDLHLRRLPEWPSPGLTLGHEIAGHVAALGAGVRGVGEGDAVAVHLVWACGTCRACRDGRDNVCITTAGRRGIPPCPGIGRAGGMAEYVAVPARFVEPLGGLDPVTAAPLTDAGLTSWHAVDGARHRLRPGSTAVVVGVGGLGHAAMQILRATTAVRVVAVDPSPVKRELARRHGAAVVLDAGPDAVDAVLDLTGGYGADVVLDFVGSQPTVDLARGIVAPDGALRFVGLGGGSLPVTALGAAGGLPWGVDVRMSYAGTRSELADTLSLARAGHLELEVQRYALDDGIRAFDDLEGGRVLGRAVLVP